jgi:hypothetical protein
MRASLVPKEIREIRVSSVPKEIREIRVSSVPKQIREIRVTCGRDSGLVTDRRIARGETQ